MKAIRFFELITIFVQTERPVSFDHCFFNLLQCFQPNVTANQCWGQLGAILLTNKFLVSHTQQEQVLIVKFWYLCPSLYPRYCGCFLYKQTGNIISQGSVIECLMYSCQFQESTTFNLSSLSVCFKLSEESCLREPRTHIKDR